MAQVVGRLLCMFKALSSNFSLTEKKEEEKTFCPLKSILDLFATMLLNEVVSMYRFK
jgi:hypothetical protein